MSTAPAHPPESGPFARFRADHDAVRHRLDQLDRWLAEGGARDGDDTLRELVRHLEWQFATHMAAEDALLFPAVADAFPAARGTLGQLQAEHAELRLMLAAIARQAMPDASAPPGEQTAVAIRDFVDLLRLHVHREEIAVFDVATRALSSAEIGDLALRLEAFLGPGDPLAPGRDNPKGNPS